MIDAARLKSGILCGAMHIDPSNLERRIAQAAQGFLSLGIRPGDCVAILMRNDARYIEASLGAMRIGAYAVPINWHFKGDEIAYILADCEAGVLVADEELLMALAPGVVPASTQVLIVGNGAASPSRDDNQWTTHSRSHHWEDWLAGQVPYNGPALPATQSMIYTSGTTGRPKGVRRDRPTPEQQAAMNAARRAVYGIEPGVRALMPGPLYHAAPNSFALRAAQVADVLVVMPRFDPEALLATIEAERISCVFMVPTMFVRLLKLDRVVRDRYDLSSLRFVMHAAAPCPPDVKRAMIDWWGPIIWEFYGATEAGGVTIISSEEWLKKPGSVGRKVDGARLSIRDEAGRELPAGEVGEVYCRIDYYPDFTYHKQPDKRAEIERDGLITCGDVGYIDSDGYLFLCDRKRDMVISGGVNIYPAEIEAAILSLPDVKDCAVFGVPDEEFGEALLAVVEPLDGRTLDLASIRSALSDKLAGYKMPRRIELGRDLPREDSGKIFKRRLRDPHWVGTSRKI